MNEPKKCKECKGIVVGRKDKVFCSSKCKWTHWNKKNPRVPRYKL